jgi:nucleotide-binding universal stress UspA family protein
MLLHAFLPVGKDKISVAGLNQAVIDEYVASERLRARDEVVAFLAANELVGPGFSLQVEEGLAFEVISRAVAKMKPDLLIIGTHGRSWLLKVLLGSVTEEALRRLDVDILVVPPTRTLPSAAKA